MATCLTLPLRWVSHRALGDAGCTPLVLGEHREWVHALLAGARALGHGAECATAPEDVEALKVEGKAACEVRARASIAA